MEQERKERMKSQKEAEEQSKLETQQQAMVSLYPGALCTILDIDGVCA